MRCRAARREIHGNKTWVYLVPIMLEQSVVVFIADEMKKNGIAQAEKTSKSSYTTAKLTAALMSRSCGKYIMVLSARNAVVTSMVVSSIENVGL